MTRLNAYKGSMADALSALFLLFAVLLAGGNGPQTVQATNPATSQSPTDLGAGGHRSVPLFSKQQFLASETLDAEAAPWGDGKPKALLPAEAFELAVSFASAGHTHRPGAFLASIAAAPYEARAPPVQS